MDAQFGKIKAMRLQKNILYKYYSIVIQVTELII